MRVVMTFPKSLSAAGGGVIGCIEIARHLKQAGVDVILMPVSTGEESLDLDIPMIPVRPSRIHYLINAISMAINLRKVISCTHVDCLLGWNSETAFLPGMLQRKKITFGMIAASPSYSAWRNRKTTTPATLRRLMDWWFRERPLRCADMVFTLSRFTSGELIKLFSLPPERLTVAYWGVDSPFFQIARKPEQQINRLVFFGTLAPQKGVFDALEALSLLAGRGFKEWEFRIAGWGDVDSVIKAIERQGLGANVTLLGRLSSEEVRSALAWAQIAILPSHMESFGLAIAEAQASGLPVISYRVGSIPEIVQDGVTGWLVTDGNTEELARAITHAINNPSMTYRAGLLGREMVAGRFSWAETARIISTGLQSHRLKYGSSSL
jgi:glycosyltransferase involved in cell wall biosynthesis